MKAKLAYQNKEMAAMLVYQIDPLGIEVKFLCTYHLLFLDKKFNIVGEDKSDKALS